ncbi:hypothetical protein SAMN05518871_102561 [Psychrobacillus sp. OK028]|nr:hypothetical protein SAMN05518871_102561 [Psychrobacillus sp. OK028]
MTGEIKLLSNRGQDIYFITIILLQQTGTLLQEGVKPCSY